MSTSDPATTTSGSDRRIWLIGAIIAALLMTITAVALVFVGMQEEASYPPGSPESAFQAYVQAWESGDSGTAWEAFSASARARHSHSEFHNEARWQGDTAHRVWIDEHTGTDDRVVLRVTVETIYDGGFFGPDRYRDRLRVALVRDESGAWKIDTPLVGYYTW